MEFACTNLDGSQKEGGNFFNLLHKEGVPRKEGFPQKREGRGGGGSNPRRNYARCFYPEVIGLYDVN